MKPVRRFCYIFFQHFLHLIVQKRLNRKLNSSLGVFLWISDYKEKALARDEVIDSFPIILKYKLTNEHVQFIYLVPICEEKKKTEQDLERPASSQHKLQHR